MSDNLMPQIVKSTAKRIDPLHAVQNLSLRELSTESGVSKSQLSNIMAERQIQNIYTLYSICSALNIPLSDFFSFDDKS